jgi:putative peptidoglycan lipid II flippase
MMISFASIGLNLILNWFFTFHLGLGHRGLALSTGFVAISNFLALYFLMRRQTRLLETTQLIRTVTKLLAAGAVLALLCWAGNHWLLAGWAHFGLILRAASLFTVIAIGGAAFFAVALLLRVEELEDLSRLVKRKLGRVRPA